MAVSVGYTWNVNQWITGNAAPRKTFNFAFTCALFSAELMDQHTRGNTQITRFGNYQDGHRINVPLDDVSQDLFYIQAYYFFNHRQYSQGAAYHYSKYQRKSAGSWLLGAKYQRQQIEMDFSSLPPEMLHAVPLLPVENRFAFSDYTVMGGYAYNAVMPHGWLFNITMLPSLGYKRSTLNTGATATNDPHRQLRSMVSANAQARFGFVYNHRALFLGIEGRFDGGIIFNKDYNFFHSTESLSAQVGMRF